MPNSKEMNVQVNRMSAEHLLLLLNSAEEGIIETDINGNCVFCNSAALAMLGYSNLSELTGKNVHYLVHHTKKDGTPIHYDECLIQKTVLEGNKRHSDDEIFWTKQGTSFPVEYWVYPLIADNKNLGSVVTFLNITERKRMEEELRVSEGRYRLLAENSKDVIWTMALDGTTTYISPAVEHLRGFTVEEAMRQPLDQIITPDSQTVVIDYLQRLFMAAESGLPLESFKGENEYYCKDGSTIWCEVIVYPVMESGGGLLSLLGVSRDITERKQYEAKLMEQADDLRELISTKDKFFSIIAHDLRSPFNGFLNLTKIMTDQFLSNEELYEFITDLNTSAANLYELLENLLEWSQNQRGLTDFKPAVIKLQDTLSSALLAFWDLANNKEISIITNIPEELHVFADEKMLESTIRNLLSNALKFTPKGGQVLISAQTADSNKVIVSVKDTGIGMSQKMLGKLFRLEENVCRPGTEGETSCGLGLHLCKGFIEKNGGAIWVESKEGIGSTFNFSLPCDTPVTSGLTNAIESHNSNGGTGKGL